MSLAKARTYIRYHTVFIDDLGYTRPLSHYKTFQEAKIMAYLRLQDYPMHDVKVVVYEDCTDYPEACSARRHEVCLLHLSRYANPTKDSVKKGSGTTL